MQRILTIKGQTQTISEAKPENPVAKLQHILQTVKRYWLLYICVIAICMFGALLLVYATPKMYERTVSVLIKGDDESHGISSLLKDIGMDTSPSSVANEIVMLTSTQTVSKLVEQLSLTTEYYKSGINKEMIYGDDVPIQIIWHGLDKESEASARVKLNGDNTVSVSDITIDGKKDQSKYTDTLYSLIETKLGNIAIMPCPMTHANTKNTIWVRRVPETAVIKRIRATLKAKLRSKDATLVDITYVDRSQQRAEDILNHLIRIYQYDCEMSQGQIVMQANEIIKERLELLENELNGIERHMADYKSANLIPYVDVAGTIAMSKVNATEDDKEAIDNRIFITKYLIDFLDSESHAEEMLPAHLNLSNPSIESQITEYNKILLQRIRYTSHSSDQNPLVMDLDGSLSILRLSISQALDNQLKLLQQEREAISSKLNREVGKIMVNPEQSTFLAAFERQQKVKESLYLYLLQKHEENELSKAFLSQASHIVDPPNGSCEPISPNPWIYISIAIVLGILLPSIWIYLRECTNTKIMNRRELEYLSLPFLGELSLNNPRHTNRDEVTKSIISLNNDGRLQVFMYSGLDFVSNITDCSIHSANLLKQAGKRVVLLDLDLRKASMSRRMGSPGIGITDFLNGRIDATESLIHNVNGLDLIARGSCVPNPTELLKSPRLTELIGWLRLNYDYVIIDTPAMSATDDAEIVSSLADICILVVAIRKTQRDILDKVKSLQSEGRMGKLVLLANNSNSQKKQ